MLIWWNRDLDTEGHRLRSDVREAANSIFAEACRRARVVLGEDCDAAALMEVAVQKISQYLDRAAAPPNSRDIRSLLLLRFTQELRRYTKRLKRLKPIDNVDAAIQSHGVSIEDEIHQRLYFEKLYSLLDRKVRRLLTLRIMGYEWSEIGKIVQTSSVSARKTFWAAVRKAHLKIIDSPTKKRR